MSPPELPSVSAPVQKPTSPPPIPGSSLLDIRPPGLGPLPCAPGCWPARPPRPPTQPHRDPCHPRLLHSLCSPRTRKPQRWVTLQWWCILATLTVTVTVTVTITTIASAAGSIQMSSFSPRSLFLLVPPRGLVMLRPSRALCRLSSVLLRHSCCQHLLLRNQQQN